ncbi:(2Fe-2S)-binding protein [Luteolibacter flavescens]|uniref:(2Fe-2S)-binding protein n=1 Tax=Luteolibacter flavescens TaxID=1859460 RepID=A0ABT3FRV4_9BACT|nr:(2Fe-2S)-binding protein [Luteolibacter flavescens]MCW1886034.1 (2Fe-2S)-binding protein [Luteolibacter flavescens]
MISDSLESGRIKGLSVHEVRLTVNGTSIEVNVEAWTTLLDLLRERLTLHGTKKGCDHGQCGACTVLLDGVRVNSCLVLAVTLEGKQVVTIEGLAHGDVLHPLQQAFIDHDAFQCGYCTPGQICSAVGLIAEGCPSSDDGIREAMSGNLCRCGAYPNILTAIKEVVNTVETKSPALP